MVPGLMDGEADPNDCVGASRSLAVNLGGLWASKILVWKL